MKTMVTLGVGVMVLGTIAVAAGQSPGTGVMVPGGDPVKRSCAFSEAIPVPTQSGEAAPVPSPDSRPPQVAANEVIGPTATSDILANGDYYPGQVDMPTGSHEAPLGSVFLSTSSPTNVGVQC